MIGQNKLKAIFLRMIEENNFPHAMILVGSRGSGRMTLISELFTETVVAADNKIGSIRSLISLANKIHDSIFVLRDVDDMSTPAKNALLKVVEECPNNNHFIMTIENIDNMLPTIRSRSFVFHMDPYTKNEKVDYLDSLQLTITGVEQSILINVCDTPYELGTLLMYGPEKFYDYARLVVDNIAQVSIANSFKITDKLDVKGDGNGYDVALFWKAFKITLIDKIRTDIVDKSELAAYHEWIKVTTRHLAELKVRGINKQMLVDSWILEVRKVWMSVQ